MTSIQLLRSLFPFLALLAAPSLAGGAALPLPSRSPVAQVVERGSALFSNESFDTQDERTEVGADKSVPHPVFLGNRDVTVRGEVDDLFAAGQNVTVAGRVADNAFVFAKSVVIDGSVGGDLFVAAQEVTINGRLEGDLYGACEELHIAREGAIDGDVHATAQRISLEGRIGGRLAGAAQRVRIDGPVGEDVLLAARSVELTANADVGGDLEYDTREEPVLRSGAVVRGETRRVRYDDEVEHHHRHEFRLPFRPLLFRLGAFLLSVIVGGLCLAVGGRTALLPSRLLAEKPARGLGVGFLVCVLTWIAALVCVLLCLTAPIGLVLFLALPIALYLGGLITAHCFGRWVLGRGGREANAFLCLLLGLVVFHGLTFVPIVGWLVRLGWGLAGLGALFLVLRGSRPTS